MLPKLVCRLVPALVLRYVFVKSMKPIGVMRVSPIFKLSGAVWSAAGCGAGGAGFGMGGIAVFGAGAAGSAGMIGARLVTSPSTAFGVGTGSGAGAGWVAPVVAA